jgi:hypothetical protein
MTGTRQLHALIIASIVAPTGCYDRQETKDNRHSFSVEKLLGKSRQEIRKQFGDPDLTGDVLVGKGTFDSFYKSGIVARYNAAGKVTRVDATRFQSGDVFRGKVLGIALGDLKKDCMTAWGNPVNTEKTSFGYLIVVWHYEQYVLELEIWEESGSDKYFGKYQKDEVKDIRISEKSE